MDSGFVFLINSHPDFHTQMENKKVNAFLDDPDTRHDLIGFLIFYKKIAPICTDTKLIKDYPDIKPFVHELLGKKNLICKTNRELETYNFNTVATNQFVYSKQNTNVLCLLRHIRNAIAHWNINPHENKEGILEIHDYRDKSMTVLTCYGIIKQDVFKKLLKEINNYI